MTSPEGVVNPADDEDSAVSQARPIHCRGSGVGCSREEAHHEREEEEGDSANVDEKPEPAEVEGSVQEPLAPHPTERDAAYRDQI